jgi:5S rRNA maturation endonuclease (ribonuclease M5)
VRAAAGIELSELFSDKGTAPRIVAEYPYTDENGNLLYQVVRFEPKSFRQRRPDGIGGWEWNLNGTRRVLYRLPEVLAAKSVLVCEGEKDCETAQALGLVATCNPGGAGKWREEYSESLRGKRVVVIADADEPGRKHAQQVAASLSGKATSVKVLEFPHAKDLAEWAAMGGTRGALLEVIRNTAEWIAAAETATPQAGAVLRRFSDIVERKLCWLWPGRIPLGKLTLFAGDPGLGKSAATIDIAARVTHGTAWPDGALNTQPGSVIILSAEDDPEDTIRPRLRVAGANLDKVHNLQAVRHAKPDGDTTLDYFSMATDVTALQDAVVSLRDVQLVIVDPISAYLGGTDSHVNAKVRGVLAPLAQVAQTLRFAVILLDHLSKAPSRPALYRPNGSIAFTAAARAVWFFAKNPDVPEQHLMLPGKMNLAREQTGLSYTLREGEPDIVVVSWGEAVSITADAVLEPEDIEERSERLEAVDWLRGLLSGGPIPAKQIEADAKAAGLAWITVRRAKITLGAVSKHGDFDQGWTWQLPQDAHQPPKMLTPETGASWDDVSILDALGDNDEVEV